MPIIASVVTNDPAVQAKLEEDNVAHLQRHLKECRKGGLQGLGCLETGLRLGLVSLEEIGTTEEEMEGFRTAAQVPVLDRAKQYLKEARAGDLSKMYPLTILVSEGPVTYQDLEVSSEEYDELAKGHNVCVGKRIVTECREGDFSELDALADGLRRGAFTVEKLGTTREEAEEFRCEAYVAPAKRYLKEAEGGNFEHFDEMRELLNSGKVLEDDLDVTQKRLEEIFKPYHVEIAKEVLAECQSGDFSRFDRLKNGLANGLLTHDDIGTTEEELNGFRHQLMLEKLRETADECRRGDFSRLPIFTMLVDAGQEIGAISQDEIDELDLDLEVWKRQDEVNMGRELVAVLRQRGFSEAGDIDRELLSRFTAKELGLTDDEYEELTKPS